MDQNYKIRKEDFVANLSGGSISEITAVTLVAPVCSHGPLEIDANEHRQLFYFGPLFSLDEITSLLMDWLHSSPTFYSMWAPSSLLLRHIHLHQHY